MSWEYRVVKKKENGCEYFEMKEVYYNEKGEIIAFGDAPVPYGETIEEVNECLEYMKLALSKEVVDYNISSIIGSRLDEN